MATGRALFFESNRVWRAYLGGKVLDGLSGAAAPADGHFPEEWLASITRASNGPNQQSPDEGLSRLRGSGQLLTDFLAAQPHARGTEVLCKLLDSAVRLPVQCHPDQAFAKVHYHSPHGKAESWTILETRVVNGEEPCLYMGFRPGITRKAFDRAAREQDIPAMLGMLHRFTVTPGETYFLPGRFPHAIGPGVFLLETMEPSDWVVQPEATCAGFSLSASDMWGPLDRDTAMDCFAYDGADAEATLKRVRCAPRETGRAGDGVIRRIIGPEITPCFQMDKLRIAQGGYAPLPEANHFRLAVATLGGGIFREGDGETQIRFGDAFLLPPGPERAGFAAGATDLEIALIAGGLTSA